MWRCGLLVIAACGRIDFDPLADGGGSGSAVACPATYLRTGAGGCYRIEAESSGDLAWRAAETQCESEGGHLAIVSTRSELADIVALYPPSLTDAFIGATDARTDGVFLAIDGSPMLDAFDINEPDGGDADDCIKLRRPGFSDQLCSEMDDYICEIDNATLDRSTFP